jgi:hypothetical protein
MNAPKTTRGQGNNQPAGTSDLTIPTLGSAPAGPIVQPGEDPAAIAALADAGKGGLPTGASIEDFVNDSMPGDTTTIEPEAPPRGYDAPREMSASEMQKMLLTLAQGQQTLTQMFTALMARDNPVMRRSDRDQFSEVPTMELEMPTDGDLDKMRRPDQRVEGVDIDVIRDMDHAAQLAFLEEYVVINIHDTNEKGAENPVPLWVNGRSVAIPRGADMAVKRKYVELLLRAKPEAINTRITRDGEPRNHIDKSRQLKYPFSIVLDRNPRGPAWARKIRSEA